MYTKTKTSSFKRAAGVMLALGLTFNAGQRAAATQYAAVLFAGDYPGPPAFDDHLSFSRIAFANNLRTWPNWTAPGVSESVLLRAFPCL